MDKEKILNELAMVWGILPQQENEVTSSDLVKSFSDSGYEISRGHIQRQLKRLCDQGFLISRNILSHQGGGNTKAYSPAGDKTWEDVLKYIKKK